MVRMGLGAARQRVAVVIALVLGGASLLGCGSASLADRHSEPGTGDTSTTAAAPAARRVRLTADDVFFAPAELDLRAGERVQLVITNRGEVDHNLTIMRLDVHQQLDAGATERVTIAPAAGTYVFLCGYHTKMRGTLRVL